MIENNKRKSQQRQKKLWLRNAQAGIQQQAQRAEFSFI